MAARLAFHFLPGRSPLHRWDARCKVFALLLVTLGLLHATRPALLLGSGIVAVGFASCRLPLRSLLRDLKGWLVLLLIVFFFQAFSVGASGPNLFPWLPLTRDGIILGAITCWRLLLILSCGVLFTLTTKPRDLQYALVWLLQPLPFLPARRIALMTTLTMRLLPLTLDHLEEVTEAARSRLGHQQGRLLRRVKYLVLPLFRRSLIRADEMATALAARGYREDLKVRLPRIPALHLAALLVLGAAVGLFTFPGGELLGEFLSGSLEVVRTHLSNC